MRLRALLAGFALLAAPTTGAEIYRCLEADGSVRFTSDATHCPGAAPHVLEGEIQRPTLAPADGAVPQRRAAPAERAPWRGSHAALLALFEPAGAEWEIVEEAPSDPADDPELRDGGVLALAARHYTRGSGSRSQVCSVEIWAFDDAGRIAAARQGLARPGWRFHQEGNLLVMLRGVRFDLGQGFHKGLFPDCERLGERIRARVAAGTR
ncbi:MAG TPA: hypothetical protein VIY27_06190 [Myxococcota bacterium]